MTFERTRVQKVPASGLFFRTVKGLQACLGPRQNATCGMHASRDAREYDDRYECGTCFESITARRVVRRSTKRIGGPGNGFRAAWQ